MIDLFHRWWNLRLERPLGAIEVNREKLGRESAFSSAATQLRVEAVRRV